MKRDPQCFLCQGYTSKSGETSELGAENDRRRHSAGHPEISRDLLDGITPKLLKKILRTCIGKDEEAYYHCGGMLNVDVQIKARNEMREEIRNNIKKLLEEYEQ